MNKFFSLISVLLFICSCNQNKQASSVNIVDIIYDSIQIDSVIIDSIENNSFCGYSGVCKDSLYYFDELLSYFYKISYDGHIGKRLLGLGNGPGELPIRSAVGVAYSSKDNSLAVMGGNYDAYFYNDDTHIVEKLQMKPDNGDKKYSTSNSYTLWDETILINDGSYLYYNILGENEQVNLFQNKDYFEKASIIMKVNIKEGGMTPMGKYSNYYVINQDRIRHLPHIYFDVDNSNFYVSYQVDSLIYVFDNKFRPMCHFGFAGRGMVTDYTKSGSQIESITNAFTSDNGRVGEYYWIKKCGKYIFRSYRKSGKAEKDGLQIYYEQKLISDIDVPHGFKVIGYIKPFFVTQISLDEENNKMFFYRFKLE